MMWEHKGWHFDCRIGTTEADDLLETCPLCFGAVGHRIVDSEIAIDCEASHDRDLSYTEHVDHLEDEIGVGSDALIRSVARLDW